MDSISSFIQQGDVIVYCEQVQNKEELSDTDDEEEHNLLLEDFLHADEKRNGCSGELAQSNALGKSWWSITDD